MFCKGNLHAHGVKLAAYLTKRREHERAELFELRGFAAEHIRDAFIDVQIQAQGTRATKPFFHAYVRPPDGERLSDELWRTFANRLEKRLGFDGQPRAIAFHCAPDGDRHMHIAWSRIDLETLTALDPGLYKNKMKELCREFEKEFGLTRVANERDADTRTRAADREEFEQSRRLDTDLRAIRNAIHDCWRAADSGQAFAAALAEQGLILARGDRRPFVIIDRAGGDHALSKRITGATAALTRARFADLEPDHLPSVAEAKRMQREAVREMQREPERQPAQGSRPMSDEEAFTAELTEEKFRAQRDRLARATMQLAGIERLEAEQHNARNYREQMERQAEEARKNEQERQQKDNERAAAGDIADAHSRYAQALGTIYDIRDPYRSLAMAALAEHSSFHKQQDALRREAAAENDPEKRRLIELRREIEGHEYMAITSERLAGIGRAITMGDNADARRDDERARQHTALANEKREQRAELQREMNEREKERAANEKQANRRAENEHGGIGSAAQPGAAELKREKRQRSAAEESLLTAAGRYAPSGEQRAPQPARAMSAAERAMRDAAGRHAPSSEREREQERAQEAERDTARQREGLKPDERVEGAPPTKREREMSAAEQALRAAAGREFREPTMPGREGGGGRTRGKGGGRGR